MDPEPSPAQRLAALPSPGPAAFAAACAQRLAFGYERYAPGKPELLSAALATLWDALIEPPPRGVLDDLADALLELVPDTLDNWSPSAQYAEDAVAAAVFAVRCAASGDPAEAVSAADRANETVDAILLYELDLDFGTAEQEAAFREHPLTLAELARQDRDLDELESAADPRDLVPRLRDRARAEALH